MSKDHQDNKPVLINRTIGEIIIELHKRGFVLSLDGDKLRYDINRGATDDEKECLEANESDFFDLLKIAGWPFIWRWATLTNALQTDPKAFALAWGNIKPEKDKCAICDEPLGSAYEDYEYIERKYCAACSLAGAEMIDSMLRFTRMMIDEANKEPYSEGEGAPDGSEGSIN
jgi:hypothetical protein